MPMLMTADQNAWFAKMRSEWPHVMQAFNDRAMGELFPPLPELPQDRLDGCTLLNGREEILRRLPKGRVCAEIGAQHGLFAETILASTEPRELHLFENDIAPLRARDPDLLSRTNIYPHVGDSSVLLSSFPDDHFDWIYIDSDHSYEGVCKDIRIARTKVKPAGFLIFNDFTIWLPAECTDCGVPYAVCELSIHHGFRFVYLALHPHLYNSAALRRPSATRYNIDAPHGRNR